MPEVDAEIPLECQGNAGARSGRYAVLRVADGGHGMDAATRARIFEPFFSTRAAGRGLGLSAALGIARACGALIHVECPPQGGSRFSVLFPAGPTR